MNIIKRILQSIKFKIFENSLNDDTEIEYSNEEKLLEISKAYEDGKNKLKRHHQTYQDFDVEFIKRKKEYERQKSLYKIKFEFLPNTMNYKNVRSVLQFKTGDYKAWQEIRNYCEEKSNGVCCICYSTSQEFNRNEKTNTQCHELWRFKEGKRNIQILGKLMAVCVCCHEIIHISRFYKDPAKTNILLARYCEINQISIEQANRDLIFSYGEKKRRNETEYLLDMALIDKLKPKYAFNELFNPHTTEFIKFLEMEFKQNKDLEE